MDDALLQLGLSKKEAALYLFLLDKTALTASAVAVETSESRTNTYMLLERLQEYELVITDDSGVRTYTAAAPTKLRTLLLRQQQKLKQGQAALNTILPQLQSAYELTRHKPGVSYFEGLDGYKVFQEDIARSDPPIRIFASDVAPQNKEAEKVLLAAGKNRVKRGVQAQMIFHVSAKAQIDLKAFNARGYEIRFWGDMPLEGEIVMYGDKVGITAYAPALITTVITNPVIASTFQALFDQIWSAAEPAGGIM